MASNLKGYDHQFVGQPPDDLHCLICLCVARDPQQINCCGKVLCKECLKEHKKHSRNCPQCRKSIKSFADTRSKREILSLTTLCDNTSSGCEWMGELCSLDKHLASCGFTLLPCPNECSKGGKKLEVVKLLRRDIEKHTKEECPRRQYECPHCKEAGQHQERTTTHLDECPMLEVPCPKFMCKALIARCDLLKHRQTCLFEKVACKYASIGCKEEVIRRDLGEHERDSVEHLQLAIDTVHQQQVTIRDLENTIAHLQSREMPMKYKFPKYDHHKNANDEIYLPAFYTSREGYKMCISVLANGYDEGKGTHVSVYAYLMKGVNDDYLPWPFTGIITIELLNQLENNNHHSNSMSSLLDHTSSQQVVDKERSSTGWGLPCYIAHSNLGYNAAKNCQYLKGDCLYFRISAEAETSSNSWLI